MIKPVTTSEEQDAIILANKVLDTPNRDPDDDLSMMSRQFLRKLEQRNTLIAHLKEICDTPPDGWDMKDGLALLEKSKSILKSYGVA